MKLQDNMRFYIMAIIIAIVVSFFNNGYPIGYIVLSMVMIKCLNPPAFPKNMIYILSVMAGVLYLFTTFSSTDTNQMSLFTTMLFLLFNTFCNLKMLQED